MPVSVLNLISFAMLRMTKHVIRDEPLAQKNLLKTYTGILACSELAESRYHRTLISFPTKNPAKRDESLDEDILIHAPFPTHVSSITGTSRNNLLIQLWCIGSVTRPCTMGYKVLHRLVLGLTGEPQGSFVICLHCPDLAIQKVFPCTFLINAFENIKLYKQYSTRKNQLSNYRLFLESLSSRCGYNLFERLWVVNSELCKAFSIKHNLFCSKLSNEFGIA